MPALLEPLGCEVAGINLETDGRFPRPPEPIPEHLGALGAVVQRVPSGPGDRGGSRRRPARHRGRAGGADRRGLHAGLRGAGGAGAGSGGTGERGKRKGALPTASAIRPKVVVCNLSTSLVVEDAARDCGALVVRAPVGEAHVARAMIERQAPIGGEGNGGVMYPALHVGRDAPVAAALILTLLARDGRRVSELVGGVAPLRDREGQGAARPQRGVGAGVRRAAVAVRRRHGRTSATACGWGGGIGGCTCGPRTPSRSSG